MAPTTQPAVTRVGELGLRPVVSVTPGTALDQAARVMRAHDVSSLVVGEHGRPVSIVTERDLTRAVAQGLQPGAAVATIASPSPQTVSPDTPVTEVATTMLRDGLRHLVVARGDRVEGVVSMRDVLAALVSSVTADTVFIRLDRVVVEPPESWLG
jgi:CBS domain-containing protein